MGGLYRLLLEKGNAKGIVGCFFGMFEVRDGEIGILNCKESASSAVRMRSAQLTRMNEWSLLTLASPELETFQRTG